MHLIPMFYKISELIIKKSFIDIFYHQCLRNSISGQATRARASPWQCTAGVELAMATILDASQIGHKLAYQIGPIF